MREQFQQNVLPKIFCNHTQKHNKKVLLLEVTPANDLEILAYLRRSVKFAEIAALAERDTLIVTLCEQLGITASDEEWQATGDDFRRQHRLFGTLETMAWLEQQRIRAEEWSQGMRVILLEKKLKEYLFGKFVDRAYLMNRDYYKRVALSQILVADFATAQKIMDRLQQRSDTFCALALEHSISKLSAANGGFLGIRYLLELNSVIVNHLTNAKEGEIIGPVKTKLGYYILKIEKWFPSQFNQSAREKIMDILFQMWLKKIRHEFICAE